MATTGMIGLSWMQYYAFVYVTLAERLALLLRNKSRSNT